MIAANLKRSFDFTIWGLVVIEAFIGVITLLSLDYLYLMPMSIWITYLVYPLLFIKGLFVVSLVRHLHDQINTYYRAQNVLNFFGKLSGVIISIGAVFLFVAHHFFGDGILPYYKVILFYSFSWIGMLMLSSWLFNISRSLRFLNLISRTTYLIGVCWSVAIVVAVLGEFSLVSFPVASMELMRFLNMVSGVGMVLGISYFGLLHRSLTR